MVRQTTTLKTSTGTVKLTVLEWRGDVTVNGKVRFEGQLWTYDSSFHPLEEENPRISDLAGKKIDKYRWEKPSPAVARGIRKLARPQVIEARELYIAQMGGDRGVRISKAEKMVNRAEAMVRQSEESLASARERLRVFQCELAAHKLDGFAREFALEQLSDWTDSAEALVEFAEDAAK